MPVESKPQLYFDDVQVGQRIPTLTVVATTTQLFFFSAATYNGHRIHYDRSWAVDVEGYPDVLVHGPLQAALMARAVTDWIGAGGRLVRFEVQNRDSAFPGEKLVSPARSPQPANRTAGDWSTSTSAAKRARECS